MNIEIDEDLIKEQIALEVKKISTDVIVKIVGGWGFEEKIKAVVRKEMDAVIQEVVTKERSELASIQQIVRVQMVKHCKAQLYRAIKLAEVSDD
jgi:hypothetical protein